MVSIVTAVVAAVGLVNVVLFVASVVIQQAQARKAADRQRKAQEEADARADAAKGLKVVVEGESASLHVVYGRALVGGVKVYHNTTNNYTNQLPAANGLVFKASDALDSNISGSKHEFLIVQQVYGRY